MLCIVSSTSFAGFWKEEDRLQILLRKATRLFRISVNGIVHIGASSGQEEQLYNKYKVPYVLWIEADPEVAAKLEARVSKDSKHKVGAFAATDKDGEGTLMRANNQLSSSLLDFGSSLSSLHPQVLPTERIQVKLHRVDTFIANDPNRKEYNVLVIDTQGAELLVLKGSVNTLKQIDCIFAEIQYDQLYQGGALVWELDAFLLEHDFVRADTLSANRGWGDALYVRKQFMTVRTDHTNGTSRHASK